MTAPVKFSVDARQKTVELLTSALQQGELDAEDAERFAEQMVAHAVAAGGIGGLTKSAKTEFYSEHHHPLGSEGLWHHEGLQLPPYIQNVAKGLMEDGMPREEAIPTAINRIKVWKDGGGHVTPEVQAASAKAYGQWEALKASHGKAIYAELVKDYSPFELRGPTGKWIKSDITDPGHQDNADQSDRVAAAAQTKAENWFDNGDEFEGADLDEPISPRDFWEQYQNPEAYGAINDVLRGGHTYDDDPDAPTRPELMKAIDQMFAQAGTTTTRPITLWRALRSGSGGIDWKNKLRPGSTFTDKGMVSTTSLGNQSEGWLQLNAVGDWTEHSNPDDVVMEIRCPTGTRIVGGSTQFIETMLHPDSRFKVVSSSQVMGHPANPLDVGAALTPKPYTRVVVDLVDDGTKKATP